MEQSPSCETNRSASQEIPRILGTPNFITTFTRLLDMKCAFSLFTTTWYAVFLILRIIQRLLRQ